MLKVLGKCECHVWGAAFCFVQKGNVLVRVVFFFSQVCFFVVLCGFIAKVS